MGSYYPGHPSTYSWASPGVSSTGQNQPIASNDYGAVGIANPSGTSSSAHDHSHNGERLYRNRQLDNINAFQAYVTNGYSNGAGVATGHSMTATNNQAQLAPSASGTDVGGSGYGNFNHHGITDPAHVATISGNTSGMGISTITTGNSNGDALGFDATNGAMSSATHSQQPLTLGQSSSILNANSPCFTPSSGYATPHGSSPSLTPAWDQGGSPVRGDSQNTNGQSQTSNIVDKLMGRYNLQHGQNQAGGKQRSPVRGRSNGVMGPPSVSRIPAIREQLLATIRERTNLPLDLAQTGSLPSSMSTPDLGAVLRPSPLSNEPLMPSTRSYGNLPQPTVPNNGGNHYQQAAQVANTSISNGSPGGVSASSIRGVVNTQQNQVDTNGSPHTPNGPNYRSGLQGSTSDGNVIYGYGARGQDQASTPGSVVSCHQSPSKHQKWINQLGFYPVTEEMKNAQSPLLNELLGDPIAPKLQSLRDERFLPFMETYAYAAPAKYGVLKVTNIPFGATQSDITCIMGRNSRILDDVNEPVHIILERMTGKTMDAYVEFRTPRDAEMAIKKFKVDKDGTHITKIDLRLIAVEVSDQAALMKDLFPLARGVRWNGARPELSMDKEYSFENFKTFVTDEEMFSLIRHTENLQHGAFCLQCPERPYECMISTIRKMPWYMAKHITLKQQWRIFDTCLQMVQSLKEKLEKFAGGELTRQVKEDRLTTKLLSRLVDSAMLCPGFTLVMKDTIAYAAGMEGSRMYHYNLPRRPDLWRHMYALGPVPNRPGDVLQFYIDLIREETERVVSLLPIPNQKALKRIANQTSGEWGYIWVDLDYPTDKSFDDITLAEAAQREWQAIDNILQRAIEGGIIPARYFRSEDDDYTPDVSPQRLIAY